MAEKLKPCPFCGGEAKVEPFDSSIFHETVFSVKCKNCYTESFVFDTEDKAVEAWNRRVNETD